jgi:uncharacterized RDD family membrane protein YckC
MQDTQNNSTMTDSKEIGGQDLDASADAIAEVQKSSPEKNQPKLVSWLKSRFDRPAAGGLVFAGFWYRLIAFLIDFPLSLILAVAVLTGLQLLVPATWLGPVNTVGGNTAAMLLIQASYFVIFERSGWKSTPGKRIFKLRVTDKRGMKLGWTQAALRSVAKLSIPITFGASVLWIFFSPKCQTLHDKVTSTLVLRKTNETFLPSFAPAIVRKNHLLVVIALSMAMSLFAMRATIMVMMPRVDFITLQIMVHESLKDLTPIQRVVEESISKNGRPPEKIDQGLFSRDAGRKHLYVPSSGSVTVLFNQGQLNGRGLTISPAQDPKTKEVVWSCAAINLPPEFTPSSCAPTPAFGAKQAIERGALHN